MTQTVSADGIASYVICPRQYEFEHVRSVSPRPSHRDVIRDQRQQLLRNGLIAGLNATPRSQGNQVDAAMSRILSEWQSSSYIVPSQRAYDEAVIREAVQSYFSGVGGIHADNLVDTEVTLTYTRDDITYTVDVDAIIEQNGQTLALRYRPTLEGVLKTWSDDNIEGYRTGESNYRRQIASFAVAGVAIRSMIAEHGLDADVDFAFVGVLEEAGPTYDESDSVTVTPETRRLYKQFSDEAGDMRQLLADKAAAILDSQTDPTTAHFDRILEKACDYCPYRDGCPEHIESEISFTGQTPDQSSSMQDQFESTQSETGDPE